MMHRPDAPGFLRRVLRDGAAPRRYAVYVPPFFDRAALRPVVLFLHGSGERGRDGLAPTTVGLGDAIRRRPEVFPALVVFPQAGPRERWADDAAARAMAALDAAAAEFGGDPERASAVGISMGGYGALRVASERPERFAAVVSVCGGIVPPPALARSERLPAAPRDRDPYEAAAERLAGVPVRLFHGADDPVVPADESRRLASALAARGADVEYTEYPRAGHAAWIPAFETEELWTWLFRRRRGG